MINLILCGGSGTRLWPLSRKNFPKQFCNIAGDRSFFQETILRNSRVSGHIIVTSISNSFIAKDQVSVAASNNQSLKYILEPAGRNTAPAVAIACFAVDKDEILLVTPSDHLITDLVSYDEVLTLAQKEAEEGFLVTFGIQPQYAETGYGYLECDPAKGDTVVDVIKFHEKPDKDTADKYYQSGNYFWNSGMFCFKAGAFLDELKQHAPEIYEKSKIAYENALSKEADDIVIDLQNMIDIPEDSIDYAVMEKSSKVRAVKSDIGWNDIGSFDALCDTFEKDDKENTKGQNQILLDSSNNFILAGNKQVVAIDVQDLVVVDTTDALLISKKGSTQDVKRAVDKLANGESTSELTVNHLTVNRPWGTYKVIEEDNDYKVKKIIVQPGRKLSLQSHLHRSEHWVVVSGKAKVTKGNQEFIVSDNESIYIPKKEKHRLECISETPLVIIEIQVGGYLGEDDIKRYEDDYSRS